MEDSSNNRWVCNSLQSSIRSCSQLVLCLIGKSFIWCPRRVCFERGSLCEFRCFRTPVTFCVSCDTTECPRDETWLRSFTHSGLRQIWYLMWSCLCMAIDMRTCYHPSSSLLLQFQRSSSHFYIFL